MKTLSEFLEVPEGVIFYFNVSDSKYKILDNKLLVNSVRNPNWSETSVFLDKLLEREIMIPKQFTEDEKVIARNLPEEYEWIVRNKNGDLNLFTTKPIKHEDRWDLSAYGGCVWFCLSGLFQSIQWTDTEPTLIADIYK
ncbi:hypothetical protein [Parasporobacterium paucivorans]|uniref:Uncharacterized protein n=1 Tax=Parasporobacterium paucivorans DSM 15970 TaxID=1122934 RepID=A0A1M6B3S6_9FIRM|nr:hypothetical protein [Parasporobacterium paucivorans]SHI43330.1 hypothetical protein SAMN02745691_00251 [Parasporobacterium paucivorans DSM 15970]